jgi:hypothetical protein
VKLSARTAWDLRENALTERVRALRAAHPALVDLTSSNPTRVGLLEPPKLVALLSDPAGAAYDPDPRGARSAREAVALYVRERGANVDPDRIVLSASTSEAYAWIFKLLCDAGDEILVPSPSYPLFGYLAGLEGVRVQTYPLLRDEGFRIDLGALERALGPRSRAIVVVHPNNPTGTFVHPDDAAALDRLASARGLAVVADEVFADWTLDGAAPGFAQTFASPKSALTFTMSGLSKVCCSPQLKLGWTIVGGDDALARPAEERLHVIADTYLSVGTPVQCALPGIIEARPAIVRELGARLAQNLAALDRALGDAGADAPLRRLPAHAGWTVLLELPRVMAEDAWVGVLAEEAGVLVQPGWFFDLEDGGTMALSLLGEPASFARAVRSLVDVVLRHAR